MPDIRPLTANDFPAVYETFLAGTISTLTADDYRPMFVPDSSPGAETGGGGFGLFDGPRLVGALGTIVSRRTITGRTEEFCNLHSWFVQPEYRGYSLALMRPVLRAKHHTLTDLSPSDAVCAISLKLGFESLDGRLTLLFRPWSRRTEASQHLGIMTDRAQILARTPNADAVVRAAIDDPALQPLLATDGDGECLVLARTVPRGRRPYCHVHHLSDPDRFARWSVPIRNALLDAMGGSFVAVERRRLGNRRVPSRWNLPVTTRQLVRPAQNRIDPSEIDTLATEQRFLRMATLPGKRLFARALATRMPRLAAFFGRTAGNRS